MTDTTELVLASKNTEILEQSQAFAVDWISATLHADRSHQQFDFMNLFNQLGKSRVARPMFGYSNSLRWDFGAAILWHAAKPEMGTHMVLSGSTLRFLQEKDYDAMWLITRLSLAHATLTRIDLAIDVFNSGLQPTTLYGDFMAGRRTGRARNASVISNSFGGETLYIGSWNAERFYRFYDKAAEQGKIGQDWKRLELVLKGDFAKSFMASFVKRPQLAEAFAMARGSIIAMSHFQRDAWRKILDGEIKKLSLPYSEGSKTREWLLTQVASAIAKYIHETGEESIIEELGVEITARFEALKKSQGG